MKDMIKITINLVAIFVASGLILGLVYSFSAPKITKIKAEEEQKALKLVMPEAAKIDNIGKWEPVPGKKGDNYVAKDADGNDFGYVVTTYGKGYAGYIKVMVATDKDLSIKAIKILDHGETPGLGDEIEQPDFLDRFKGKKLDQLQVVKNPDPNKIEAISGATISSRGVTNGVKTGVQELVEKYQGVTSK